MGCVLPAGQGQAPARQASIGAGVPPSVGAVTINKVCGSGLKAVVFGSNAIASGEHDLVVAGGMESMTNAPYLLPKAREGLRLGHAQVIDSMIQDGLWDAYKNVHMGDCGELCAREKGITRQDQDAFAAESYRRALKAQADGKFRAEIVSVELPARKPGATLQVGGVTILAPLNLPATVAFHASVLFSRNLTAFILAFTTDRAFHLDFSDDIQQGAVITHDGEVRHARTREAIEKAGL